MQFLVYLTVLMVSVSTVLLEVHWLTSPPPQPKATIQPARAPVPIPKVDGPSAALSPVYPRKPDTPRPAESDDASANNMSTRAPETAIPVVSAQQPASAPAAKGESPQKSRLETTGFVSREEDARQATTGTTSAASRINRCDIQVCSSAYKSFRASDCTYQPFEGSRRVCEKQPAQQMAREQRDEPQREKWSRDVEPRNAGRRAGWQADDDTDESAPALADDLDRILIRRFRW